ncbi:MAG: UvrABC system protein A [Myxococcales bacterium]
MRPVADTEKGDMIDIRGAREHNLQDVSVRVPKNRLVVFTGPSGSGKSSLAFDTLFAEGQRRYIESLSAYARQFLGQMEKPRYDSIRGLSPTISIEQKTVSANPRSTVGTITEIYDYLRLLFARVGRQHCHSCGRPVGKQDPEQIVAQLLARGEGTRLLLLAPISRQRKGEFRDVLDQARRDGYTRVRVDGVSRGLDEEIVLDKKKKHDLDLVVDRVVVRADQRQRLTDSVETALRAGKGHMAVQEPDGPDELFSEALHCAACDLSYPELTPPLFSFNTPLGMCPECNGLGVEMAVDPARVVPDPTLSLKGGAIEPWTSRVAGEEGWTFEIARGLARTFGLDLDAPFASLSEEHRHIVLHGSETPIEVEWKTANSTGTHRMRYEGVVNALLRRWRDTKSEEMREWYGRYLSARPCGTCEGSRLNPAARSVRVAGQTIPVIVRWPVRQCAAFFDALELVGNDALIGVEIVREIRARLSFLLNVGLDYLTLDRAGGTLSGGESQRIRLASQIGSELTGVLYILDEPTIGLHQRDNRRLIATLERLRDIGNSVLVVEHDLDTILAADRVYDFGPGAGRLGGRIVAEGTAAELASDPASITGAFLSGRECIPIPPRRRAPRAWLTIRGPRANNLAGEDIALPLGVFCAVTGVSGAGKSTLVNQILLPALSRALHGARVEVGEHDGIDGLDAIDKVIDIDQRPIGRTPRSNPATYTKLLDHIRTAFASTKEARTYGYGPGRFSFNVKGGRCERCEGAGSLKIEMHFLADVYVPCDQCGGRRFNEATLRVRYKGHSIADVLEMSVDEAVEVFGNHRTIRRILETLAAVGLGYIHLGQPSHTLSGGEAQRVKLSRELAKVETGRTLYVLDEPSTGLHFDDVRKLLGVTDALVEAGNTVVMIEHNLDIIKTADWVVDLGPEGGDRGGRVVAQGTPEQVAGSAGSYTGEFLERVMQGPALATDAAPKGARARRAG